MIALRTVEVLLPAWRAAAWTERGIDVAESLLHSREAGARMVNGGLMATHDRAEFSGR